MQRTVTPYQQLKALTHKFIDTHNNSEYSIVCSKFETVLIELSNDFLVRPDRYSVGNYATSCSYKKYLRILASNMDEYARFGIIRRFKEFLDTLEIETRLEIMKYLGEFLVILAYGRNPRFFEGLDKHNGKDKTQKDEGHYPYIAYSTAGFITNFLFSVHRKFGKRKSFVDVGCGIGDKVFLAWMSGIFDECIGIEYEGFTANIGIKIASTLTRNHAYIYVDKISIKSRLPSYLQESKKHEALVDFGIIQANAFDVTYRRFDTIYFYHPIANTDLMRSLYEHVFKTMQPKTIFLEMMQDEGLKRALENINDKKSTKGFGYGVSRNRYYYKTTTNKLRARKF